MTFATMRVMKNMRVMPKIGVAKHGKNRMHSTGRIVKTNEKKEEKDTTVLHRRYIPKYGYPCQT
jgi:ABC-type branched-subunit amino acid transport system ATPase component